MSDEQLQYWTAWWAVDGIGWVAFQRLIKMQVRLHLTWSELWSLSQTQPERLGLSESQGQAIKSFSQHHSPKEYLHFLAEKDIGVVLRGTQVYPYLLQQISDPPPVLFYKGNQELIAQPMIGVVGTRHVTEYGELVTRKITRELSDDGWVVISGFMYGVDAIAHQTTAEAGGKTVGVLGFGFEHLFPKSQLSLFNELVASGQCFVTEYAPHIQGKPGLFPRRNRLIAGMSQGVVVTEAADKSGSLITAEYAAEYGRSIYAVPGPITSPFSNGTRALLNIGALCISSGQQVTEDQELQGQELPQEKKVSALGQLLCTKLGRVKKSAAELQSETQLEYSALLQELTELELLGKITRVGEVWQLTK